MEITVGHLAMAAGLVVAVNQTASFALRALDQKFRAGRELGWEAKEIEALRSRVEEIQELWRQRAPLIDQVRSEVLVVSAAVQRMTADINRLVNIYDEHLREHRKSDALLARIAARMESDDARAG